MLLEKCFVLFVTKELSRIKFSNEDHIVKHMNITTIYN